MATIFGIDTSRAWARKRQSMYFLGFGILFFLIGAWLYRIYVYEPPNCFDGAHNGDESGIDCGGVCALVCVADVTQPTVQWVKSFKIKDSIYHAVAYVENKNEMYGTPELSYVMKFYDALDGIILERSGTTILPPEGVYPIFEGNINTAGKEIVRTTIDITPALTWYVASSTKDIITVESRELLRASTNPRLDARLFNTAYTDKRNVKAVATIFDSQKNPLTVSYSTVPEFTARESRSVVFTWPEQIATTIKSCEVPTDIVIVLDRSGSMAADGGTPPEPLESAKRSAVQFIETLQDKDKVSLVSYATEPKLEFTLTNELDAIKRGIMDTRMGTGSVQYTNIRDAIVMARDELSGQGHNPDARKVIVLITDGDVTRPLNAEGKRDIAYATRVATEAALETQKSGVTMYTIGFGKEFNDEAAGVARNRDLIKALASSPEQSFDAPTIDDLKRVYDSISNSLCEDGPAIIDIVPMFDPGFIK